MTKKNDEIENIAKRYYLGANQSTIRALQGAERREGFPTNLLVGIFLIESKARPLIARSIEYLCVFAGIAGQLFFQKPVKSYTIGKFQVGLPEIMNYIGVNVYDHTPYVKVPVSKIPAFLNALLEPTQVEILTIEVLRFYKRAVKIYGEKNVDKICIYIGEQYNGRYSYGLLLGSIVSKLSEWTGKA